MTNAVNILIKRGLDLDAKPYTGVDFTEIVEVNQMINDLEQYPHAYVLACLMDRQIKAERAWMIPYKIRDEVGDFEMSTLCKLDQKEIIRLFEDLSLHRFNEKMAKVFYLGIKRLDTQYDRQASAYVISMQNAQRLVFRYVPANLTSLLLPN